MTHEIDKQTEESVDWRKRALLAEAALRAGVLLGTPVHMGWNKHYVEDARFESERKTLTSGTNESQLRQMLAIECALNVKAGLEKIKERA